MIQKVARSSKKEQNPIQAAALKQSVAESKKAFLRYISHELRNPLNISMLGINLLENHLEDDLQGAWTRLAELERTSRILERDVAFIDLRLPDRLIVRLRNDPNAVPEKPLAKKKTSPAPVIRQAGSGQTT